MNDTKLKLIKSCVYIMSLMLIIGIGFLIYGMWVKSKTLTKPKDNLTPPQFIDTDNSPSSTWQQTIQLAEDDELNEVWSENNRLISLITTHDHQHIIYIYDMTTGRLIGNLNIK